MMLYLARPFSYLSMRHQSGTPGLINWALPFGAALVFGLGSYALGLDVRLFGDEGLVPLTLGFVQTLTGFYLAALAAMATFDSPSMDKPMPGSAPIMKVIHNGVLTAVEATRRRFLCSMFSYLTAFSFAFTVISILLISVAPSVSAWVSQPLSAYVQAVVATVYFFCIAQMTTITFWGLYYMGERVHIER